MKKHPILFKARCNSFLFVSVFRTVLDNPILEQLLGVLVLGGKSYLDSKHHQPLFISLMVWIFGQVGPCLSLSRIPRKKVVELILS